MRIALRSVRIVWITMEMAILTVMTRIVWGIPVVQRFVMTRSIMMEMVIRTVMIQTVLEILPVLRFVRIV